MNRTCLSVVVCMAWLGLCGVGHTSASSQPTKQAGASDKPPIFDTRPYAESRAAAEASGKWFIVKATAVWCAPCKQMDRTTWRDEKVVSWLKEHAVAVAVDVDENRELAESLGIQAMPTIIAFKDGKEFDRVVGMKKPDVFLEWLEGMAQGKKSIEAAPRRAANKPQGAPGDQGQDMQARIGHAREMVEKGRRDEAAAEYEWLWKNMLAHSPSMYGVRLSFMAGDMKRLAAADEGAKARFTKLRDEAGAALRAEKVTADQAIDWVALNGIIQDENATLEWFDRVKDQPRWRTILGYVERPVCELLIERERWADLGMLVGDPVASLRMEHQILEQVRASVGGGEFQDDTRQQIRRQQDERFLTRTAQVYGGLLAAGRNKEAAAYATQARTIDSSPEMTDALVTWALKVNLARAEHAEWLAGRTDPDGKRLATEVETSLRNHAK